MSAGYLIFLFFSLRLEAGDLASRYQSQAVQEHLDQDEAWLSLLHFNHGKSDLRGEKFFYAEEGWKDAKKELQADIHFLFASRDKAETENFYCQMPARSHFLIQRLNIHPKDFENIKCPKYDEWRKKIAVDQISIVFATAGMDDPSSLFGHTFLKISSQQKTKEQDLLSYSVDFSAATGEDAGFSYIAKGLFGFYKGYFSMQPYHLKSKDYLALENRGLWEYPLILSKEEKDKFIFHLLELEKSYADYYFLSKNCSYQILTALEVVSPKNHFKDKFIFHVIPSVTIQLLHQAKMIGQGTYRPSLLQKFSWREENLSWQERFKLKHNISKSESLQASPLEEARILETELLYYQLLDFKGEETNADLIYQLKLRRASLGQQNTFSKEEEGEPKSDPLLGHKSARIGWGQGSFAHKTFSELQLRPAYHDILSSEEGFMPYGQLELLETKLRYFSDARKWQLKSFLIADVFSGLLWDSYFHKTSFHIEMGAINRSVNKKWADSFYISGGKGIGLSLSKNIYAFPFVEAYTATRPETDENYQVGTGTAIYLVGRWAENFRLLANVKRIWYLAGHQESIWQGKLALSYNPFRNHEFRVEGEAAYAREVRAEYLYYY